MHISTGLYVYELTPTTKEMSTKEMCDWQMCYRAQSPAIPMKHDSTAESVCQSSHAFHIYPIGKVTVVTTKHATNSLRNNFQPPNSQTTF